MYNNDYQEYINYMIGATPRRQSEFQDTTFANTNSYNVFQNNANVNLEQFYPELYKLIYPMIQTACMRNTGPITEESIDEMVRNIYSNFNADDVSPSETINSEMQDRASKPKNFVLNDLIRILLIRELLGRPGNVILIRPGFTLQSPEAGGPLFRPRSLTFNEEDYEIFKKN